MKGLMNNEKAVKVFHKLKDSMIDPIHQIYNLGYKQGYEDGHYDCMQRLTEQILAERDKNE